MMNIFDKSKLETILAAFLGEVYLSVTYKYFKIVGQQVTWF